jgi:hypothetical protein
MHFDCRFAGTKTGPREHEKHWLMVVECLKMVCCSSLKLEMAIPQHFKPMTVLLML